MKRGLLVGLIMFAVIIIGFIVSCAIGIICKSWIVFLICISITIFVSYKLNTLLFESNRINMDSWLESVSNCNYKYAWDGYGIAIDTYAKKIHLISQRNKNSITKTYDFSDIREWSYEMPGAKQINSGQIIGGGIGGGVRNVTNSVGDGVINVAFEYDAIEKTGLYFTVRDIDCPVWFIKFKCKTSQDKQTKFELSKWMEILRQNLSC